MRIREEVSGTINDMTRDLRELKNSQFIGKGSILSYKVHSSDLYDLHFFSDQVKDNYELVLTHSVAPRFIGDLVVFVSVDNTDVMNNAIGYSGTAPPMIARWKKVAPPVDGQTTWRITFINSSWGITNTTYDVYAKFFINGSDSGTWVINAV